MCLLGSMVCYVCSFSMKIAVTVSKVGYTISNQVCCMLHNDLSDKS